MLRETHACPRCRPTARKRPLRFDRFGLLNARTTRTRDRRPPNPSRQSPIDQVQGRAIPTDQPGAAGKCGNTNDANVYTSAARILAMSRASTANLSKKRSHATLTMPGSRRCESFRTPSKEDESSPKASLAVKASTRAAYSSIGSSLNCCRHSAASRRTASTVVSEQHSQLRLAPVPTPLLVDVVRRDLRHAQP